MLSDSNVGCYWGGHFAGAVCYADVIVLLAPSASALRRMLSSFSWATFQCRQNSINLFSRTEVKYSASLYHVQQH